jgi:hypothetical protein
MVGVELSGEGGRWQRCGFSTSVLAWEGRWWDEALPKDEAKAASSSWLHGKKVWHGAMALRCRLEDNQHWEGDDVSWADVNLTWLKNDENPCGWFSCYKMDIEDLKQWWVIFFKKNVCKWDLVLFISLCRTQWWKQIFKWISYEWDKSF